MILDSVKRKGDEIIFEVMDVLEYILIYHYSLKLYRSVSAEKKHGLFSLLKPF
jgi:hypothetical protein